MHLKLKKDPTNSTLEITYKRYRNFCNNILHRLKAAYKKREFDQTKNDHKATWKLIKNITYTINNKSPCKEVLNLSDDPKKTVNFVNQYFVNTGAKLAKNITRYPTSLPTRSNFRHMINSQSNSLVLLEVDGAEIERIILSLRKESAAGWYGIPATVIQSSRKTLIRIITHICNLSIITAVFPKALKKAMITPNFKAGGRE